MLDYAAHIVKPVRKTRRSILLKGPSGTGKTHQFRTLVEGTSNNGTVYPGLKVLYVCVDEHMGTIEDLDMDMWPINTFDVPLTPAEKKPEQQDFIKLMDYIRSEAHPYDAVYFDSLMNYADKLVNLLKRERGLSGYELWLVFGEKMRKVLELLVSLTKPTLPRPVHVVGTWGVEVAQDWEGNRAIVPIVDGKMVGPRIDYFFDDVLMLRKKMNKDTEQIDYLAYTGGTQEFDAKVSSGMRKLPTVITNPNLYRILLYIRGEL